MKTKSIFYCLLVIAVISSCKKSTPVEPDPIPDPIVTVPTITYHISKDSVYNSDPTKTEVKLYIYNSSKKVVKIKAKSGVGVGYTSYDTVHYNSSNQVSKVERFNVGSGIPSRSNVYNYTSGLLTSVNESGSNSNGTYVRNRIFTYSGATLATQVVVYTTGSSTGGADSINTITYVANNFASLYIGGAGNITATADLQAPNPYFPLKVNSEEFLEMFNPNNILKAYVTATPTMIFVDNTYTYTNGRVSKIVNTGMSPNTTVIEYIGL